MEKELKDTNTKLNEYKSAVIAKENEYQNLIKGNEKLHSDLQSTKNTIIHCRLKIQEYILQCKTYKIDMRKSTNQN